MSFATEILGISAAVLIVCLGIAWFIMDCVHPLCCFRRTNSSLNTDPEKPKDIEMAIPKAEASADSSEAAKAEDTVTVEVVNEAGSSNNKEKEEKQETEETKAASVDEGIEGEEGEREI